jgi:carbohydrate kinase (thermoresistant glucokinase family)
MPYIYGLRSGYAKIGRLVYFGRMLDKIRLHANGKLPADYHANLGVGFDGRTCTFLGVDYSALRERTLHGGTDVEILAWAHARGTARTDEECAMWNRFMTKIGWRDDRSAVLQQRIAEYRLQGKPIETFFDLNEYDEGRDPVRTRAWELRPALIVVLMGVAGSGKTTIGNALAQDLGWRFDDADRFHPPANIAKMSSGVALDDNDRAPWLSALAEHITTCVARDESAVVTCSALKAAYRQKLSGDHTQVKFVYLKGTAALLRERLSKRERHFMKPAMLDRQLAALEEPAEALVVDIAPSPEKIVADIRAALGL